MSWTSWRFLALLEAWREAPNASGRAYYEYRLRMLAVYLIGRYA